jgi:hypothetical protein
MIVFGNVSCFAVNTRVYVHNLPWGLSTADLETHFASAGTLVAAQLMTYPDGRSKVRTTNYTWAFFGSSLSNDSRSA